MRRKIKIRKLKNNYRILSAKSFFWGTFSNIRYIIIIDEIFPEAILWSEKKFPYNNCLSSPLNTYLISDEILDNSDEIWSGTINNSIYECIIRYVNTLNREEAHNLLLIG